VRTNKQTDVTENIHLASLYATPVGKYIMAQMTKPILFNLSQCKYESWCAVVILKA